MILYLIKNNFKLMFRNKWIVGMMVLGPIIVIAVLSGVFKNLMKSYEGVDEFTVGYRFVGESIFKTYANTMIDAGKDAGITFTEYTSGSVKDILEQNDCRSFVEFSTNTITIYRVHEYAKEGMMTVYFFDKISKSFSDNTKEGENIDLPLKQLSCVPKLESNDYYGIIYIAYFICWCYVSISVVIISEKKNKIEKKFKVAPVSEVKLYLAKCIPCVLVTICEMAMATTIVSFLFDIQWGNLPLTVLILGLTVITVTMFGLFFIYLFNNLVVAIVAAFVLEWVAGYVGGSFEAYYFSPISESIKALSPIYHINRSLVEYSAIGQSNYTGSCIAYLLIMSTICFLAGLGIAKIRKVDVA